MRENDGSHVFARTVDEHNGNVQEWQIRFFREDDSSSKPQRLSGIVTRNRYSLERVDTLAPGVLTGRLDIVLRQTPRERALLAFSTADVAYSGLIRACAPPRSMPRIDVFDGRTFELVNRIDVETAWGCPAIIPLPAR